MEMQQQDPYMDATRNLGGRLRGLSLEEIMESMPDEEPSWNDQLSDLNPLQEKAEDPISDKVMEFIKKLQG